MLERLEIDGLGLEVDFYEAKLDLFHFSVLKKINLLKNLIKNQKKNKKAHVSFYLERA